MQKRHAQRDEEHPQHLRIDGGFDLPVIHANLLQNIELRLAGALGLLTSGSSGATTRDGRTYGQRASYDFDNDLVTAISTSLKIKF